MDPLARLLRRLDLERVADDRFRGGPGRGDGRVFGGMLAAQGVVAAARTAEDRRVHSVHVHFLRPGRHGVDVEWTVTRLRDGRAFAVRHVVGSQLGLPITTLTVSCTTPGSGLAHQERIMPEVPPPESLTDWEDLRTTILGDPAARRPDGPLEVRDCDADAAVPAPGRPARRALWMRPRGTLPDDPLVHAAMVVFASDRGLLSTAGRPHGLMWGTREGASLDHAVWLHVPPRFDDWILSASDSAVASEGRGFVEAGLFARDGMLLASVAQEGLIRARPVRRG
jgi:acyl-CoA thioesterase-2